MSIMTTVFLAATLLSQKPQSEVYVLRHGETTWNVEKKIQGQSNVSVLTTRGKEQVEEVIERLKPRLAGKSVEIYSSDLSRAHDTAKIIAKALEIEEANIHLDADLREANFGRFEGTTKAEYEKDAAFLRFKKHEFLHAMDPENGESYMKVAMRIYAALLRIAEQSSDKTVLVITHGGAMRSLQMRSLPVHSTAEEYNAVPNPEHKEIFTFDPFSGLLSKAD